MISCYLRQYCPLLGYEFFSGYAASLQAYGACGGEALLKFALISREIILAVVGVLQ
jgi:hypothetical protein